MCFKAFQYFVAVFWRLQAKSAPMTDMNVCFEIWVNFLCLWWYRTEIMQGRWITKYTETLVRSGIETITLLRVTYCCCRSSCRAVSTPDWPSPAWPVAKPSTGPRAGPQPARGCCWSGESGWWRREWPAMSGQGCCSWLWWWSLCCCK